ncbi:MAG: polysaccharide biosynthesis protein [Bacilli bacterium]|nr:polysaccharide biosynthesis protein [Bacilli bacterium]
MKFFTKRCLNNLILIFVDIFSMFLSSYLALGFIFDFSFPSNMIFEHFFIDIVLILFIFYVCGLYRRLWSLASIFDFIYILFACIVFEFIGVIYKGDFFSRGYYFLQLIFLIIFVFLSRYFLQFVLCVRRHFSTKRGINTLLVGAGEAGLLLINEIHNDSSWCNNRIVCIIDDDKNKIGTMLGGIVVVGGRNDIFNACIKYNIREIIIAIPSAKRDDMNDIVKECQRTNLKIKVLPPIREIVGNSLMGNVRKLSYVDFLGRNEIVVNIDEISDNLVNKVILVTGGGGSIGSELCRQIASFAPKLLLIFDIYENGAYDIEQELLRCNSDINLKVVIGSVRDYDRMETIFKKYHPDVVFHAAAHKHVPIMEDCPNEAIKNNCLGTLNVVKLSHKYHVSKFVLISTDKAVRPTNIMGASKRICEMIIQTYNNLSKTDFVAVRFGNVLGSNGSVIPLFLKQIESGGPVTVTHKDITRFFMTIPEAVNLILQAYVYANGGEIFVLDMGEPVKIYDLAKKLIRYKGFEPDVDIEIKITGLRLGEKLYEEILMDEEGLRETPNKLIHIGSPIKFDEKKFLKDLDNLISESYKNSDNIKECVANMVDTYKIDKRGL